MSSVGTKRMPSSRPAVASASASSDDASDTEPHSESPAQRRRLNGHGRIATATPPSSTPLEEDVEPTGPAGSDIEAAAEAFMESTQADDPTMPLTIKRVSMKNLRCHKNFEIEFGPHINIIVGRNGSGKSSILTAIKLALGMNLPSQAATKKSGSSAQESLVRAGSDGVAVVQVDFTNVGVGALDPTLYGKHFVVRRTLSLVEGGKINDKFEILREGVTKVSVTKSEFTQTLQKCNVFHKNPVMIMDQETSKQFFSGSTKDQYHFFMEATLLKRNYEAVVSLIGSTEKMKDLLDKYKVNLQNAEDHRNSIGMKLKAVQRVADLAEKLNEVKIDVLFADHNEKRAALEAEMKMVDEKHNFAKVEVALQKLEASLQRALDDKAAADQKLSTVNSELAHLKELSESKVGALQALIAPLQAAKKEEEDATKKLDAAKKQLKAAESELREFEAVLLARDVNSERNRRLQRIAKARSDMENAAERLRAAQAEMAASADPAPLDARARGLQDSVSEYEDQLNALRSMAEDARRVAKEPKLDPIARLKNASGQSRNASYKQMLDDYMLVQSMVKAGEFTEPPVGPLFAHIKVQPKWQKAFETTFKAQMSAYLFSNSRDAAVLERKLGARKGRFQYIVKPKPTPDMLRKYEDRKEFSGLRLCDVLKIEDDWVRVTVHDELQYERVLLANDYAQATALASRVQKMKYVLMPDGRREMYSTSGSATRAPDSSENVFGFLMAAFDGDEDIATTQVEDYTNQIRHLEKELLTLRPEVKARMAEAEAARRKRTDAERKLATARQAEKVTRQRLQEAEDEPEPQDTNEDDEIKRVELQERLAGCRETLDTCEKTLRNATQRHQSLKPEIDALRKELEVLQRDMDSPQVREAEDAVRDAATKVQTLQGKMKDVKALIQETKEKAEQQRAELAARMQAWEHELQALQNTTNKTGPSNPDLTSKAARAMAKQLAADLDKESRRVNQSAEAVAEIKRAYDVAEAAYQALKKVYDDVNGNLTRLKAERREHMSAFKTSKSVLCTAVEKTFRTFMAKKNYDAKLTFTHDADDGSLGQLEIFVTPDKLSRYGVTADAANLTASKSAMQHVSTLSGGEKSSSTNILLAAIARCSPVPFRIMDEFDVFQDETSRKLTLRFLLEQGSSKDMAHFDGRFPQMILLTPHDVSAAMEGSNPDVKVLRLKDPERTGVSGDE